ncbi:Glyco_hydro_17 domain-containing protein/X8 domain-containing protein [Cephalotus follicularis]|uniref:glucan endo-1,3-beta-D-glucosidase n=1 Tax=Cephalotus follicularis TaxID=3775 RepID=A0A1Q3ASJ4_CEPFO|nr:Glyco_hydro_17 domain-containing protein/X8 domain-containing protein [Cephalotus follicularis]
MLKMVLFFHLLFLCLLGLTGAGQEYIELLNLYGTNPQVLPAMSPTGLPKAVSVSDKHLNEVSTSVLKAETWLRNHVLAQYPATKITTIVVGDSLLCQKNQDHNLGLVLPSLKNIYHSLTRWGLEKEIEVSAAFTPSCLNPNSALLKDDLTEKVIKPLLEFLQTTNSTYSVKTPSKFSPSSDKVAYFVSSHLESIKKLGFLNLDKINVIVTNSKETKPMKRKLSSIEFELEDPNPARPTPLPEISPSQIHSSIGFSVPANVARNPQTPQSRINSPPPVTIPFASPPAMTFPVAPERSPRVFGPASSPHGFTLPPCNPADTTIAPAPQPEVVQRLWCVAKPSVPADTLQQAMDYACGEGGADCEEVMPQGSCFNPDTVVAHASYAFNSYWQKTKRDGGSCSFGGTAMLINADPSFLHCRFVLS